MGIRFTQFDDKPGGAQSNHSDLAAVLMPVYPVKPKAIWQARLCDKECPLLTGVVPHEFAYGVVLGITRLRRSVKLADCSQSDFVERTNERTIERELLAEMDVAGGAFARDLRPKIAP